MPRGVPKDWTLEELTTIWEHDGSDGLSPDDHAVLMDVARGTWYSIKARLREEGGPQGLYDRMQRDKLNRYNAASQRQSHAGAKRVDTLAVALARRYEVRIGAAGRSGAYAQYTVTIPPMLAEPFIEQYGRSIMYEAREDGILIKPVPTVDVAELPAWVTARTSEAEPVESPAQTPTAERSAPSSAVTTSDNVVSGG